MKQTDLAYFAGFFDGEGSITLHKRKARWGHPFEYLVNCTAGQNYQPILRRMAKLFGGTVGGPYKGQGNCAHWQLSGKKVVPFLEKLLPFLIVKRKQALLALRFRKRIQRKNSKLSLQEVRIRDRMCQQMRRLNRAY